MGFYAKPELGCAEPPPGSGSGAEIFSPTPDCCNLQHKNPAVNPKLKISAHQSNHDSSQTQSSEGHRPGAQNSANSGKRRLKGANFRDLATDLASHIPPSVSPASPPATGHPQENGGGKDRVANPDVDALKARHGRRPPPAPTGTKGKCSEATGPPAAQAGGKIERAEIGWTTVERKRRGGVAKRERRAEIVDGRGVTTFWSTPEGLYESWRPYQHRGEASRGSEGFFRGARYFIFLSFCALVGSGAASDRPASAGRGGQERSVSSSP